MPQLDSPVAYLVGHYPAVSHTFIAREIQGLRERGLDVRPFTLHRTPERDLLTDADRAEAAATQVVLPPRPWTLLSAHARAFVRSPTRYLGTLRRTVSIGEGGLRHRLWALFYFVEGVLVWHMLRRDGIAHVHSHFANAASNVAMAAAAIGRSDGMSWSFTMHGHLEFDEVVRYGLTDKVQDASFVACIGNFCRAQLMRLTPPEHWERLHVVRCGLDLEEFVMAERRREEDSTFRVLSVGRLSPEKGQRLLMDAILDLRRKGVDARLTLVGDGPDREALVQRVHELGLEGVVSLPGAVGQDRIRDFYADADVFCLSSFAEGIPVVLMEAMALGVPVVSTRIMGVPELVEDGRSGLLVPAGVPSALSEALFDLAQNPPRRASFALAGRQTVEERFDIRVSADRMAQLFGAPAQLERRAAA